MNVEIICVGTELLLGDILNTNAKFLSEKLAEMGFNLFSQSVVGDNSERLERQLSVSLSRSNIVILSGGLGPTDDDITKETIAKVLNLPLEEDEETLERIEAYFKLTGRAMSKNNKKQALKIKGSVILENDHGTAPGIFLEVPNGAVVLLPGPPLELVPMFNNKVVPMLKKFSKSTIFSRNIRIFGVGESTVAELCGDLLSGSNPTVATYAKTGEVDIRVTASAENHVMAKKICEPIVEKLVSIFGNHVYGIDVENLQQKVVETLRAKNLKLATAESCTAGMLSERITEIPGSSEVFEMGVTAYANYVKVQALGVDPEVIEKKGAVSDEVAAQMAMGIRAMCGADIGVGITGVAGPGQSEGKPSGLVYVAIADSNKVFVRKITSRGISRDTTRILATSTALDMVRRYMEGCEDLLSFGTPHGAPIKLMDGYENPKSAILSSKKTEKESNGKNALIYSDEELMDMFNAVDEEAIEEIPEKLEIDDGLMDFIFDEDEAEDDKGSYYSVGRIADIFVENEKNPENKKVASEQAKPKSEVSDKTEKPAKKRGFFASLFPSKADPLSEKIRKTVFIIAFLVLIGTMIYLVNYFVEGWNSQGQITSAAEVWDDKDSMTKNEDGIFIGFEALKEQNSDIRAWIKIEGTNINNPVYQTKNNDFYVDHDMEKRSSRYGAIFIDKDAKIGKETNSQNVVIYGHHMKDGTMFGPLKKYTDISFYKKHPIIDFTTLYREGQYKVFAVFITNTIESHDNGEVFNYRRDNFGSDEDFLGFIDEVKKRSIINTGVDVSGDDEIITLSTCTYEFEEARLVVMARRVRDGETNVKDTSGAQTNPNPLYPQIWYDKKGGKKPVFSSNPSSSDEASSSDLTGIQSDVVTSEEAVSGFNAGTTTSQNSNTSVQPSTSAPTNTTTTSSKNPANNTTTSTTPPADNTTTTSTIVVTPPAEEETNTTPQQGTTTSPQNGGEQAQQ